MASGHSNKPFELQEFSLEFTKRAFEHHPQWLDFRTQVEVEEDGVNGVVISINLPSQHPTISEPLRISVGPDPIPIVSWLPMREALFWHHDWTISDAHEAADEAVQFVDRFTAEKIAAFWTEDRPGEAGVFGIVSAQDVRDGSFPHGKTRTEIRSWRGSFDQSR